MAGPVGTGLLLRTGPAATRLPSTTGVALAQATRRTRTWTIDGPRRGPWPGARWVSTTVTTVASFSDPHTFNLPTVAVGDRIVLVCSILDSLAATTPVTDMTAWTSFLASELNAFHTWRGWTIYIADTSMVTAWSGGTVVVNSDNGGKSTALAVRVADGASGAVDVGWDFAGPTATGADANPNPPELVPGWSGTSGYDDHTLWLSFATYGSGGDIAISQPQDYNDLTQGAASGGTVTGMAWRQNIAGGEDPGAFILSGPENWQALTFAVRPVQPSGTLFTVGLAGTLTASGALVRQPRKALAGTITRLGTLTLQPRKVLAGSAAPTGALATARTKLLALAGSIGLGGTLTRRPAKVLGGVAAPSGALTRRAARVLAGSTAPAGTLATTRTKLLAFAGSIGLGGAVSRSTARTASGALTPGGTLSRRTTKLVAGVVASSGVLTSTRTKLLALAGSIGAVGALSRRTSRTAGGTVAPSGTLTRRTAKALAGAVAPTGGLVRRVGKTLAGLVALSGVLDSLTIPGGPAAPLGEGHDVRPLDVHGVEAMTVHQLGPTAGHEVEPTSVHSVAPTSL